MLQQCQTFIKQKLSNPEIQEYNNTAQAAKDLSRGILTSDTAVIAPKICQKVYNLDLLEERIQDLKLNITTFIVATN